jgi:hypothetical protein
MLLFAGTMVAQTPKLYHEAASPRGFAPDGWHVYFTVRGDLNNDRVDDIAFILEDNYSGDRVLAIAFGKKKGNGYILQEQDRGHFIAPKGNTDAFDNMSIQNNTLTVKFLLPCKPGYEYDDRFGFQFQNGRFELVGWERRKRDVKKEWVAEFTSVSYTYKKAVYEDRTKKSETRQKNFDFKRFKTFSDIVPGQFVLNYDKL